MSNSAQNINSVKHLCRRYIHLLAESAIRPKETITETDWEEEVPKHTENLTILTRTRQKRGITISSLPTQSPNSIPIFRYSLSY